MSIVLFLRIPIILTVLFIFIFMGYLGQFIEYDSSSSIDNILRENDPVLERYKLFKDDFGYRENVIVALETEDIYTNDFMVFLLKLTDELQGIDGINHVISLPTLSNIYGDGDELNIDPFIDDGNFPMEEEGLSRLRETFLEHPFVHDKIVSDSGDAVILYVELDDEVSGDERTKRIVSNRIRNAAVQAVHSEKGSSLQRIIPHFVGDSLVSSEISKVQQSEGYIATVMIVLLGIVLLFVFKSVWGAVIPLFIALTTICLVMGLKAVFDSPFSTIDGLLYALIFTISIGDSVHILSHWFSHEYRVTEDRKERISAIVRRSFKPCFYTSLTTAIGFGAIALSDIPQLRHFGIFASLSVIVAFLLTMTFLPAVLTLFNTGLLKRKELYGGSDISPRGIARRASGLAVERKREIVLAFAAVLIAALAGITRINIGTDPYSFLSDKTEINRDLSFIEERFCGIQDLEVVLDGGEEDYFKNPAILSEVERLRLGVAGLDSVTVSSSPVSFVKLLNRAFHDNDEDFYRIPESRGAVAELLFLYEISDDSEDLYDWISFDYSKLRLNFKVKNDADLRGIKEEIESFFNDSEFLCDYEITGSAMLWDRVDRVFLNSQLRSLLFSILLITLILFIIFRSVKLGIIAFAVNVFPLAVGYGVLGYSGIGLNMGTILIAPIAIGIAVDDTIHFITRYKLREAAVADMKVRLEEVYSVVLKPIALTSFILAAGFSSNCISRFKPNAYFGIVSAVTLIVAMISDLVLLPALIVMFSPKEKKESK